MTAPRLPLTAVTDPGGAFAASMLRLRQARGWSARRLACESGISEGAVYRMESGRGGCHLDTAWRIAEAFGVSMDAMVRGEIP